jgi:N,N'-diacetyllegionaminate synthase
MKKVIIIAEAGVNHNGSIKMAKELIDVAASAGADYIKFQTFVPELCISPNAIKADYQRQNDKAEISQLEMVKNLQLSFEDHIEIINHCKERQIKFATTAFDPSSQEMIRGFNLEFIKIPSGEITNLPYLKKSASFGVPVYLSTGMATLDEVRDALQVLMNEGVLKKNITVLHCNTEYPTPMRDVNLLAMQHIKKELDVNIGYSDHTLGIEVPIAAVALGATVIEKHFTLDRRLSGPDHNASLEPKELIEMVKGVRNVESAISGSGRKEPSPSETKNKVVARKSIHLVKEVKKGEVFEEDSFFMLRPGDGISPMEMYKVVGKTANKNLPKGHKIAWEEIV